MNQKVLMYISILVIYFVVDVAYQVAFGLKFMGSLYDEAGISGIMSMSPQYPATIPLFFLGIAYILLKVVVVPAVEKRDVKLAFVNGALVGVAAYGTLGLVFLWSIAGFPVAATFEMLFEGLLFPTLASGLTAWWVLRNSDA